MRDTEKNRYFLSPLVGEKAYGGRIYVGFEITRVARERMLHLMEEIRSMEEKVRTLDRMELGEGLFFFESMEEKVGTLDRMELGTGLFFFEPTREGARSLKQTVEIGGSTVEAKPGFLSEVEMREIEKYPSEMEIRVRGGYVVLVGWIESTKVWSKRLTGEELER